MKSGKNLFLVIMSLILIHSACKNESVGLYENRTDSLAYENEIFTNDYKEIYGEWVLNAVSGGTLNNNFEPDFERIEILKIGNYKLFKNDSLISFGQIRIKDEKESTLKISFVPERGLKTMKFYESERLMSLRDDHLNLFASCCDRYNLHFSRID